MTAGQLIKALRQHDSESEVLVRDSHGYSVLVGLCLVMWPSGMKLQITTDQEMRLCEAQAKGFLRVRRAGKKKALDGGKRGRHR